MRLIFLCLILCVNLFSEVNFSPVILRQKIGRAPAWMAKQIEDELAPYQAQGIDRQTLAEAYEKMIYGGFPYLVYFTISSNQVSYRTPANMEQDHRVLGYVKYFEKMAEVLPLPNVEFLLCFWDSFDNPVFLKEIDCPVFAFCKKKTNQKAVLIPEVWNWDFREWQFRDVKHANQQSSWEQKHEKAFWRGLSTGGLYTAEEWDYKPRSRLVLCSREYPEAIDAAFTGIYWAGEDVKEWMRSLGLVKPHVPPAVQVGYKYLIAIEGNTFASSLRWQLLSNSVVLKGDTEFIEWFDRALEPYVHFFPFKRDCQDLLEMIDYLHSHDDEAKRVAQNATDFFLKNMTLEDTALYIYELLLAYQKLQNFSAQ